MRFFGVLILLLTVSSCTDRERKLRQKEAELNQKEQELNRREKALQSQELDQVATSLESDSTLNTSVNGLWTVTMTCIETDCEGSAVGDIKTERWDISYKNRTLQAAAKVNDRLTRVYSGEQNGNIYSLTLQPSHNSKDTKAKMSVKLRPLSTERMEGRREIYRDGCRIIYSLELEKQ